MTIALWNIKEFKRGVKMENKKGICMIMTCVCLLFCVACATLLYKRHKGATLAYEPSLEVAIDTNFTLQGQDDIMGYDIPVAVSVKKAVISSGAIALFQNYYNTEDTSFLGVKDIVIHMKNGKTYDLWDNCEEKSVSYEEETGDAVTYILFDKALSLNKIESLEIAGQEFAVSAQAEEQAV